MNKYSGHHLISKKSLQAHFLLKTVDTECIFSGSIKDLCFSYSLVSNTFTPYKHN